MAIFLYYEILKNAFKNDVNVGLNYSALTLELYKQLMKIIPDKEFIDVSQSIDNKEKWPRGNNQRPKGTYGIMK